MKPKHGSPLLLALCWIVFVAVLVLGLWLAAEGRILIPVSGLWEWRP